MRLEKFIDSVNYRYENTLRINFNIPLGLGSYCDNLQDLKTECDYVYEELSETYDDVILSKLIDLFDNVNNTLREKLGDDVELDWRDDSEIEIHNVKSSIDLEDLI
jgi:hypothetical protein